MSAAAHPDALGNPGPAVTATVEAWLNQAGIDSDETTLFPERPAWAMLEPKALGGHCWWLSLPRRVPLLRHPEYCQWQHDTTAVSVDLPNVLVRFARSVTRRAWFVSLGLVKADGDPAWPALQLTPDEARRVAEALNQAATLAEHTARDH